MTLVAQILNFLKNLFVLDALLVAIVFAVVLLYAYTIGSQRLLTAYFAVAFAALITFLAPSFEQVPYLNTLPIYEQYLILFFTTLILTLVILWQNRFFDPYIVPSGLEKVLFSLSLAGWLIVILGSIVPAAVLPISESVQVYFLSDVASIIWLAAPIAIFGIFRGNV